MFDLVDIVNVLTGMASEMNSTTMSMPFELAQISSFVYSITELDPWDYNPLMYLIVGDEKVLLIDTGCDYGNLYFYIKSIPFVADKKIVVVNTHNHAEQSSGNWRFSTVGSVGLSHKVERLYASGRDKYYTRLLNSTNQWQVKTYKVTHWLKERDKILLGPKENLRNVVHTFWMPGHTPDHIILHYPIDNRLFLGDIFYRFADINFTYQFTELKDYEASLRKILDMLKTLPAGTRYSSSRSERDGICLPELKHFQRFFFAVLAGTHTGVALRIDDAEGWRYETRDRAMRVVLSRTLVQQLEEARNGSESGG
ncbi:hypothetical protein PRIPAC_73204 [Pristionchus pacificus]|uniref:Lactamase_B domain-containing protein n=1 Tax=Pristionchus pacificus TaxID=54126 RepID=A0A2A6BGE1_PRIPA|nr:hypothetical protein PRIPAC_73204 [Pristionchus pacificus]|eukprot:PDM64949.1 hypothetical protein PRIPAC_53205 [Pristionchus pacificus]